MRSYGQFCPIARASEILAERWTVIILRNILVGCRTFSEIREGAPGIPKSLLAQRLRLLERYGVIRREPNPSRPGSRYLLTEAGEELGDVCDAVGKWGARWLELGPQHLDPGIAVWSMSRYLVPERLPDRRVVIRFDFLGHATPRFWLLIDRGEIEVCRTSPGFDEDLVITADPVWFIRWRLGWISWGEALRAGHLTVAGSRPLARAFPTWLAPGRFDGITPVRAASG